MPEMSSLLLSSICYETIHAARTMSSEMAESEAEAMAVPFAACTGRQQLVESGSQLTKPAANQQQIV